MGRGRRYDEESGADGEGTLDQRRTRVQVVPHFRSLVRQMEVAGSAARYEGMQQPNDMQRSSDSMLVLQMSQRTEAGCKHDPKREQRAEDQPGRSRGLTKEARKHGMVFVAY